MAKSALNTAHALYSDLVFALGEVDGGSGNVVDLVSGSPIGVLGANTVAVSDPTHGTIYRSDGGADCGINFGDIAAFDGLSAITVLIVQKSNVGQISANTEIFRKDNNLRVLWQSSENFFVEVENSSGGFSSTTTDFLHDSAGEDPTQWHAAGFTQGANIIGRINTAKGTVTAVTAGTIQDVVDILQVHFTTTGAWNGDLGHIFVFGRELNDSEWNSAATNYLTMYAGEPATLSSPQVTGISDTQATFRASTNQPTDYGTATGYLVLDTPANITGIGAFPDRIKNGNNVNNDPAIDAGTVNITESPFSLTLTGLSLTIGAEYGFAWLQENNNGDSNVLTGTFNVSGINVSSFPSSMVPGASETISATLVGTTEGTVEIEDSKHTIVSCNITSWPTATGSGDIVFDVPDAIANNLKPGPATLRVINNAGDDSAEVAATMEINPGWSYGVIAGVEDTADAYLNATPTPQVGHMVLWQTYLRLVADDSVTANPVDVILNELTYKIPAATPPASYYFDYTFFDESDNTYDNTPARRTVNLTSADVTPENIDLGADILDAEPGTVIVRPYTMADVDPGIDIGVVGGGVAQFSTDGVTPQASITRQLGEDYYGHFTVPAFGQSDVGTINANGVTDEIVVSARAAVTPVITTQPQDALVEVGDDATFTIAGNNIDSVQWRVDGVDVAGETGLSYTRTTTAGDLGTQTVDAVAQSADGVSATSDGADLEVVADLTPPVFTAGLSTSSPQTDGFTVGFTVNEAATVYGIAVPQGSAVPTPAQIIARADYNGVTVLSSFNVAALANTARNATVSGIVGYEGQPVTVYVTAVDGDGNQQLQQGIISATATLYSDPQNAIDVQVVTDVIYDHSVTPNAIEANTTLAVQVRNPLDLSLLLATTVTTNAQGIGTITSTDDILGFVGSTVLFDFPDSGSGQHHAYPVTIEAA